MTLACPFCDRTDLHPLGLPVHIGIAHAVAAARRIEVRPSAEWPGVDIDAAHVTYAARGSRVAEVGTD
jgi:hypothetical protein